MVVQYLETLVKFVGGGGSGAVAKATLGTNGTTPNILL